MAVPGRQSGSCFVFSCLCACICLGSCTCMFVVTVCMSVCLYVCVSLPDTNKIEGEGFSRHYTMMMRDIVTLKTDYDLAKGEAC